MSLFVQITESVRDHLNVGNAEQEEIDETLASFYESMYEMIKTALVEAHLEPFEVENMILIALEDLVQHQMIATRMKKDRWLADDRVQDKIKEFIADKKRHARYLTKNYSEEEMADKLGQLGPEIEFLQTLLN